jgi:hypothetical protein
VTLLIFSIGDYRSELSNLHVMQELGRYSEGCDPRDFVFGIPRFIFVCIHTTNQEGYSVNSRHVIATSKE